MNKIHELSRKLSRNKIKNLMNKKEIKIPDRRCYFTRSFLHYTSIKHKSLRFSRFIQRQDHGGIAANSLRCISHSLFAVFNNREIHLLIISSGSFFNHNTSFNTSFNRKNRNGGAETKLRDTSLPLFI